MASEFTEIKIRVENLETEQKKTKERSQSGVNVFQHNIIDHLNKQQLIEWLRKYNIENHVLMIYKTPRTLDTTLIMADEHNATGLWNELFSKAVNSLGSQNVSLEEISKKQISSLFFSRLLGTLIPFELDSIDFLAGNENNALKRNYRIKMPAMSTEQAKKVLYLLFTQLNRLIKNETELTKQNITMLSMNTVLKTPLKPWQEFLDTLPDLPSSLQDVKSFEDFNDGLKREAFFYLCAPKMEKGNLTKIMCDSFDDFILGILRRTEQNPVLADTIVNELRKMHPTVVLKYSLLSEILTHDLGEKQYIFPKETVMVGKQSIIPIDFDIAKLPYKETDTILIIDKSGGMGKNGLLSALQDKMGIEPALRKIAKKTNQFITIVAYNHQSELVCRREFLNENTVESILEKFKKIEASGSAKGLIGLESAWSCIPINQSNVNVILCVGGIWVEVVKVERKPDGKVVWTPDSMKFPELKKNVQTLFKTKRRVPIKSVAMNLKPKGFEDKTLQIITALGEEGSQIVFAEKQETPVTISEMMLTKQFRILKSIHVEFIVNGDKLCKLSIKPFFTNEMNQRYIHIPEQVRKALEETNQKQLTLLFIITYDDGIIKTFEQVLAKESILAPISPSAYFMNQFAESWIDDRLFASGCERGSDFKLLSGTEQLNLLTKIFMEATELNFNEVIDKLTLRLENCTEDWVNDRIAVLLGAPVTEFAKKTKNEQITMLEKIYHELKNMGLNKAAEKMMPRLATIQRQYTEFWIRTEIRSQLEALFGKIREPLIVGNVNSHNTVEYSNKDQEFFLGLNLKKRTAILTKIKEKARSLGLSYMIPAVDERLSALQKEQQAIVMNHTNIINYANIMINVSSTYIQESSNQGADKVKHSFGTNP